MSDAQSPSTPESAGYPARLDVEYPDGGLNRVTTLFRIVLVIPIGIVAGLLTNSFVGSSPDSGWAVFLVSITLFGPTLLMILFRQKYPRWWFDRMVRDHLHGPLPPGTVRLRARRAPLGTARRGLHVAAHHRQVPAVLPEVAGAAPR